MVVKKNSPSKILFLIPSLRIAGAEKICASICDNLNFEEFSINLISLSNEVPLLQTLRNISNIKIHTLNEPSNLKFPWIPLKSIYLFYKIVKEIKPEVIHSHLWGVHCIYLYPLILLKNKPKFLATIHSAGLHYDSSKFIMKYFFFLESFVYRLLKFQIVSVSKNVDDMVKRKLSYLNSTQIDNGIDTDHFYPSEEVKKESRRKLNIENKYPIILHVGRAAEVKRQQDIIEAVSILKSNYKDIILLLVGRENKEKYQELVFRLSLNENVKFLGINTNMFEIINSADIGVFPSLYEGLSLALAEQMSCGLPMIVSDIPSLREMCDDGKNAILVPIKDPISISNAVSKIINDPNVVISLGKSARKYVKQKYSIHKMVSSYEVIYKNMLN